MAPVLTLIYRLVVCGLSTIDTEYGECSIHKKPETCKAFHAAERWNSE